MTTKSHEKTYSFFKIITSPTTSSLLEIYSSKVSPFEFLTTVTIESFYDIYFNLFADYIYSNALK